MRRKVGTAANLVTNEVFELEPVKATFALNSVHYNDIDTKLNT